MSTAIFPIRTCCRWKLDEAWIARIGEPCRNCPTRRFARFMSDYGLTAYDASV